MNSEQEYLEQRVLRTLLRHGQMKEGKLSAFCHRRMFEQSWRDCVSRLTAAGLLSGAPTGHGVAQMMSLTAVGRAKAERVRKEASEQAAAEILTTASKDAVKETAADWLKSL